jgi:hypothetical protein
MTLHTGEVIEVELETLVYLAALAGYSVALFGYLHTMKHDLRAELKGDIAGLGIQMGDTRTELKDDHAGLVAELRHTRTELKRDIADLRTDLRADIADVKADIGRLDGRLTTIEQRTYDLSTRLPPAPARPAP